MDIRTQRVENAIVLVPVGEVDLSCAPSLRVQINAAQSQRPAKLVIDLSEVPYMDSSGVATLVEAMQNARRTGTKLVLCSLQPKVRSIFEIARLDTVFTIVGTADEGLIV